MVYKERSKVQNLEDDVKEIHRLKLQPTIDYRMVFVLTWKIDQMKILLSQVEMIDYLIKVV